LAENDEKSFYFDADIQCSYVACSGVPQQEREQRPNEVFRLSPGDVRLSFDYCRLADVRVSIIRQASGRQIIKNHFKQ
jgi:hypothetical protein